ncbi:MAG: pyruvate formate-lyase-activating protein [Clostridia bacterium]|nr:pyruvate formate-lyase-activating protein [Clostridia bacterium]
MKKGCISSVESMGLVDGPGIRYVVFMQGCNLRCQYCHNPETWPLLGGETVTAKSLIAKIERFKPYYQNGGGVTFSGGEPLLQPEFLLECLRLCRRKGIHTTLDTAGVGLGDYQQILSLCDLVILDIKAVNPQEYHNLTGKDISAFNDFLKQVQESGTKLWIRQVIVPGMNDNETNIKCLAKFINHMKNVERVELLPYKSTCKVKYQNLHLNYRLDNLPDMDEKRCDQLQSMLRELIYICDDLTCDK